MNLKDVLSIRGRYTLVTFNEDGFPLSIKFKLAHLSVKPVGSEGAIRYTIVTSENPITGMKFINLIPHQQFIIFPGHWDVDTRTECSRGIIDTDCGATTLVKRWPAFDPRYLLRVKKEVVTNPVAFWIEEATQPEILINHQCIS